jgi:hypothetical protein
MRHTVVQVLATLGILLIAIAAHAEERPCDPELCNFTTCTPLEPEWTGCEDVWGCHAEGYWQCAGCTSFHIEECSELCEPSFFPPWCPNGCGEGCVCVETKCVGSAFN